MMPSHPLYRVSNKNKDYGIQYERYTGLGFVRKRRIQFFNCCKGKGRRPKKKKKNMEFSIFDLTPASQAEIWREKKK